MDKEEQTLYYYVVALKNLHLDHDPEFSTAKDGLSLFRSYILCYLGTASIRSPIQEAAQPGALSVSLPI